MVLTTRIEPNQFAECTSARANELRAGFRNDEIRVPLTWTNDEGLRVVKTFVFRRGSYRIDIEQQLNERYRNGAVPSAHLCPATPALG